VSPSMNTRTEKAAVARRMIAAAPAMARSTVARCRVAAAARGLKGSAKDMGRALRRPGSVSTVRRAPRQAWIATRQPCDPAARAVKWLVTLADVGWAAAAPAPFRPAIAWAIPAAATVIRVPPSASMLT